MESDWQRYMYQESWSWEMFGFLYSLFLVLIGLWISWTKTQTLPYFRIPDTSGECPSPSHNMVAQISSTPFKGTTANRRYTMRIILRGRAKVQSPSKRFVLGFENWARIFREWLPIRAVGRTMPLNLKKDKASLGTLYLPQDSSSLAEVPSPLIRLVLGFGIHTTYDEPYWGTRYIFSSPQNSQAC